ncbi:hypothetical protein ACIOG4_37605 [Streptomyces microflavus]|uniref:hypothetical protein n=1 Tax=Streptomyces microflavus TaxID=1919 RepID=UPI003821DC77
MLAIVIALTVAFVLGYLACWCEAPARAVDGVAYCWAGFAEWAARLGDRVLAGRGWALLWLFVVPVLFVDLVVVRHRRQGMRGFREVLALIGRLRRDHAEAPFGIRDGPRSRLDRGRRH